MSYFFRIQPPLLVAVLATLALRALAPDGYMPGSPASGLLYELCPDGMPAAIFGALAGNAHSHHHGGNEDAVADTDQCPIGHMLASVIATDSGAVPDAQPQCPDYAPVHSSSYFSASTISYRSRGPPA